MKRRILVVEDDAHLADGLRINLELEGYDPVLAGSGEAGLDLWRRGGVELVLLDVMLPGMDGFEVCRLIRREGDRVPILFLTARGGNKDRIRGLDEGGDDYITKPFELQELLARIKSIFRRQDWFRGEEAPDMLRIGRAEVNLRAYQATTPEGTVDLKEKEAMILRLLREHAGEPVDRETILDRVWGFGAYPTTRTVDNFILALRKLVEEDPRTPRHILTVHGVGYRLVIEPRDGAERTGA
ncbi:MAG TPA: response regulator transcription factor [Candidatus Krumholzibacteria bacterium]|nr:response regulator transcription factor [Candidatus Krumholzibacteria bacterium]